MRQIFQKNYWVPPKVLLRDVSSLHQKLIAKFEVHEISSIGMFRMPADQYKRKPSCGAKLDMAKIKTTELVIVVYIVTVGEWRLYKTLVPPMTEFWICR